LFTSLQLVVSYRYSLAVNSIQIITGGKMKNKTLKTPSDLHICSVDFHLSEWFDE